MSKLQLFRMKALRRAHNCTLIFISAVYVAFLTVLGMWIAHTIVRFFFGGQSVFAAGIEVCSHFMAIVSFLASLVTDLLDQTEGTKLGILVDRVIARL